MSYYSPRITPKLPLNSKTQMADNSNDQIKIEEQALGLLVARRVTDYVKSQIRASTLMLRGIGSPYKRGNEAKPLLDATFVMEEMGEHRLLGFKFMSNRTGFVHHYGSKSDNVKYTRTHPITGKVYQQTTPGLTSQAFFDDIYTSSGALALLEDGLSKTRTRDITIKLQNTIKEIEING